MEVLKKVPDQADRFSFDYDQDGELVEPWADAFLITSV